MPIRKGTKADIPAAHALIKELATYEREPDAVVTTVESMERDGFGERPLFEFFVAELDGEVVGMALYFYTYSTWKGKTLYLEDLVVTEKHRCKGIGRMLFDVLFAEAKAQKVLRMAWQVLDWNEPAIAFYKSLDAELDGEWVNCRVSF